MRTKTIFLTLVLSFVAWVVMLAGCNPTPTVQGINPANGPESGGGTVTITGTNFKVGAQVDFGGKMIPANVSSATSLTCTAPAGSVGPVKVTVVNPKEKRAQESVTYTYEDATAPQVSSVTPSDGQDIPQGEGGYTDALATGINTVSATFSEDVASAEISIAYETLPDAIKKDATGTVAGTVSVSGTTATWTSSEGDLRAGRKYTVTVSGADAAGNKSEVKTSTFSIATPKRVHFYVVQPGDTLKSIAARPDTYEDERMASKILRVNQDYTELNRNRLRPGTRLIIHW
jgi:hypothetical protein